MPKIPPNSQKTLITQWFSQVPKDRVPKDRQRPEPRAPTPPARSSKTRDSRPPSSEPQEPPPWTPPAQGSPQAQDSLPSSSRASNPPAPSPSPLHLPSSPVPDQDEKAPRGIDAVINGSDDGDDSLSSDEDLPNLFAKPRTDEVPGSATKGVAFNPCVTPKAKRPAISFYSSPVVPRHKFDMKALLSHAKSHDADEASAERMSNLLSEGDTAEGAVPSTKPGIKSGSTLYDAMMDVLSEAEGEDEEADRRHKLLRAVKRTEALMDRKRWCFFDPTLDVSWVFTRTPFPKTAAKGAWKCLADPKTRHHIFGDGLAYTIQLKRCDLPDEIFLWVLNEIFYEKSEPLRQEYGRLLGACSEQIRRFFDGDRLDTFFLGLGACNDALDPTARILGVVDSNPPYPDQNWSVLQSILTLLNQASSAMTVDSLIRTISILLRLGIDGLVIENIAVRKDFSDAIENLVSAVPIKAWDRFCEEVCISFHEGVIDATLWAYALVALPAGNSKVVELRRRLALVLFYDEHWRGAHHPDDQVDIPGIIRRLEEDDFVVNRETDYYELSAHALILTIAIGDGCPPSPSGDPGVVRKFDEDVDKLCRKVKRIWSGIDTGGAAYVSRLEARTAWQNLEHQLPHVVRTRPPPKTGILDLPKDKEDPFQPKQRKFMAKFLKKESPTPQPLG